MAEDVSLALLFVGRGFKAYPVVHMLHVHTRRVDRRSVQSYPPEPGRRLQFSSVDRSRHERASGGQ